MEFSDERLASMINDYDEDIKDFVYLKYKYIVDIVINKYKNSIYALNLDMNEVRQDALLAFSDALNRYQNDKDSSLPTFISLVVERKILNCVRKGDTAKNKMNNTLISLEQTFDDNNVTLENFIGDETFEPLTKMQNEENYNDLLRMINELLSPFEKDVYNLVINGFDYIEIAKILNKDPKQIDNTIQRIRNKIKDLV